MNRFVYGVFSWENQSAGSDVLVARLRSWRFGEPGDDAVMCLPNGFSISSRNEFWISLDLNNEPAPKLVHFFGNLPEVYCNDRYELSTHLDRAREKLLSGVIRKLITEAINKEAI